MQLNCFIRLVHNYLIFGFGSHSNSIPFSTKKYTTILAMQKNVVIQFHIGNATGRNILAGVLKRINVHDVLKMPLKY